MIHIITREYYAVRDILLLIFKGISLKIKDSKNMVIKKKGDAMDPFSEIYDTLLGLLIPEEQLSWVENAFEEKSICAEAYEEMRKAYERILDRLGMADEDEDLETMVTAMEHIQKELCKRSFQLGIRYVLDRHFLEAAQQGDK